MNNLKTNYFLRNRRSLIGVTLLIGACLSGLVWAGARRNLRKTHASVITAPAMKESPPAAISYQGFTQGQAPTSVCEGQLITITPYGIEPAALTTSQGHFILAYENRSGLENVSLGLSDDKDASVHQLDMALLKSLWTGEFKLDPGTYQLKERSHPDWVCTITVP